MLDNIAKLDWLIQFLIKIFFSLQDAVQFPISH